MGIPVCKNGYNFFHVASAFQKCVRRGMEHEALYFGTELYRSGYEEYAWYRMKVMVSEDVGVANATLSVQLQALYLTWQQLKTKQHKPLTPRLPFLHAVMFLVRGYRDGEFDEIEQLPGENFEQRLFVLGLLALIASKKSRMVDEKISLYFTHRAELTRCPLEDFVFDMHTTEGKRKGRGVSHFYDESAKLENVDMVLTPDEYAVQALVRAFEEGKRDEARAVVAAHPQFFAEEMLTDD